VQKENDIGVFLEIAASVVPTRSMAETTDGYPAVVAVLDAKTRVSECRAGIQWILQRKTNGGRFPWASMSFCRTKEALLRCVAEHTKEDHPTLAALPDRFQERGEALESEKSSPTLPD
jgi:hypothetical protein